MATIHPSHAERTDPKAAKPEGAVTRPSDGIDLAGERFCCEHGPHRLLRAVSGLPEPFDAAHEGNVYTRAAWDFAAAGHHATPRARAELHAKPQSCLASDELE